MLAYVPDLPLLFSRLALGARKCALLALALSSAGCARQEGAVELDWSIVDGNFDDLFPGQRYSSSCALEQLAQLRLPSQSSERIVNVDLKLQVRLRVFDCPNEQSGEECQLAPPVKERVFDCDHMRGTIGRLPSSDRSYLFAVDTLLTPNLENASFIVPKQRCVATPGVRRRLIRAGQITNLAVYQVVIGATPDRPLLFNDCAAEPKAEGTGEESSTAPDSTLPNTDTSQSSATSEDTAPPPKLVHP